MVTPTTTDSITNYVSVDPTGGGNPPAPSTCKHAYLPAAGCGEPVSGTSVVPVELMSFTAE